MKEGDLVNVYAITNKGKQGPVYTGIYMGWDRSDRGWIVMTNGAIETFMKGWWSCEKIPTKQ